MKLSDFIKNYYSIITTKNLNELETVFDSDSPFFSATKHQYEQMRMQFNLAVDLQDLTLISQQKDLIVVRDKIFFTACSEEHNVKSINENLHILVLKDNQWKIHQISTFNSQQGT